MSKLYGLTTERLFTPVGIDVKAPRLAWKIDSDERDILQVAYRVTVHAGSRLVWDSGRIISRDMVVRYAGQPLESASDHSWEVTVELSNGEELTGHAWFMTGLMDSGLMEQASWITMNGTGREDVPVFRKEFTLTKKLRSAKLFSSGCGIYEVFINGRRVCHTTPEGEARIFELKPGFTEVLRRKFYHSFDITPMLAERNCLCAVVSSGWWSDQIVGKVGRENCFRAVLVLRFEDGSCQTLLTDERFRVSVDGPVRKADVYYGEDYDAGRSLAFLQPGYDDSHWENAVVSEAFDGQIQAMHGEPTVCRADLCRSPKRVYTYRGVKNAAQGVFGTVDHVTNYENASFTLKKGETAVVDFGQNAAGRVHFTLRGKAGTTVELRHGEMLNDRNGERSRGNDGPSGSVYTENLRSARAAVRYTIGQNDTWEAYRPLLSFFGFQYVSITAEDTVEFSSIQGEVLTNVSYDSGHLTTGSADVNRLIENGRWGMYSNYLSLPTDCPQRDERLGWTADTQVFVTTAHYYSTAAQTFLEKWSQDLRDSQNPDGQYTAVAPRAQYGNDTGAMGWADAGILMPYYQWRMTGDTTLLREHYHSMKRYMDDFLFRRGNLGPDLRFGDWLSFEPNDTPLQEYLSAVFYAFDAKVMSVLAGVIGKTRDAEHYAALYEQQKQYCIRRYIRPDGTLALEQQTAALYALYLDLVPDEASKNAVKDQLQDNIKRHGNRLQTGFLGTAILLPALSQLGLSETAYTLLLQDQMPSWLYSVKAGATTAWERWNSYSIEDGFGEVSMNSFNHYAYGAVAEWMFGYMAGIRPQRCGFDRFVLKPEFDRRVGRVQARYDSLWGRIESAWHYEGEQVLYRCKVPANTRAVLTDPFTKEQFELGSGEHRFTFGPKV